MASRLTYLALAFAFILSLSVSSVLALEPLTFYGFDEASQSAASHEGMQEIFSGRCFHSGVPVAAARMMMQSLKGSQEKLGYDPTSSEGRFYAQGRFMSPPGRTEGSDESFGLGESVFFRDGKQLVGGNCFACHAGVVNGQVVAGLGKQPHQPIESANRANSR